MKTLLTVLACLSAAVPAWSQTPTLGTYRSSLDSRVYEVRARDALELAIYSTDGALLTTLERNKPGENFKGKTQTLAPRCPQNAGKIETTDVKPDRIRMRVEIPSNLTAPVIPVIGVIPVPGRRGSTSTSQLICNSPLPQWQAFELIRDATGGASTEGTGSRISGAPTGSMAPLLQASFASVLFEVTEASAQGSVLTVTLSASNQGADRPIDFRSGQFYKPSSVQLVDNAGATHYASLITVGSETLSSTLLNGVKTPIVLTFKDFGTTDRGPFTGEIKRLSLPKAVVGKTTGALEFRDIRISTGPGMTGDSPGARSGTASQKDPEITVASVASVQFQLTEAVAQGSVLTVTLSANNQGADRTLDFRRVDPTKAAQLIDETGSAHYANLITIGNQDWSSVLLNGVKTSIVLTFKNFRTVGTAPSAHEIKRLTLPALYVDKATGSIEFRNIAIRTGADSGGTQTGATATTPEPPVASYASIQFQVTEAVARGNVLTVTLSAINQGTDRQLTMSTAQVIEDLGKTYNSSQVTIGNQQGRSDLLNGVRTIVVLTFREMGVVGGVLEASEIRRLTATVLAAGQSQGMIEFRNIKISKNSQ